MKNFKTNENAKNTENAQIKIPCGSFCANNCSDCKFAEYDNRDNYGRISCGHSSINAWVYPSDRFGCWFYEYNRS